MTESETIQRTVLVRLKRKVITYQHQDVELKFTDADVREVRQIPDGERIWADEIEFYAFEVAELLDKPDQWVETRPEAFEELDSEIEDADPPLPTE